MSLSLENFTHNFAKWAGSSPGFLFAFSTIVIGLLAGSISNYSHVWETVLTLYIGSVTFLMVFLIQRSQNKELMALHIKLNELINASHKADNHLIAIEQLTEKEIKDVQEVHLEIAAESTPGAAPNTSATP